MKPNPRWSNSPALYIVPALMSVSLVYCAQLPEPVLPPELPKQEASAQVEIQSDMAQKTRISRKDSGPAAK